MVFAGFGRECLLGLRPREGCWEPGSTCPAEMGPLALRQATIFPSAVNRLPNPNSSANRWVFFPKPR